MSIKDKNKQTSDDVNYNNIFMGHCMALVDDISNLLSIKGKELRSKYPLAKNEDHLFFIEKTVESFILNIVLHLSRFTKPEEHEEVIKGVSQHYAFYFFMKIVLQASMNLTLFLSENQELEKNDIYKKH